MKSPISLWLVIAILLHAMLFMAACSSDDSLNSSLSQLTAEMCLATTNSDREIVSAVTDSNVSLTFSEPLTTSWTHTPDSVYRALLYYDKALYSSSPQPSSSDGRVRPFTATQVHVMSFATPGKAQKWSSDSDPLGLTSAWFSPNGTYLNLHLTVKTGTPDGDPKAQTLGLVRDTIVSLPSTPRDSLSSSPSHAHHRCRLCHNQNGMPAYYSVDVYASIPVSDISSGDTISITMPLWQSTVTKHFIKP